MMKSVSRCAVSSIAKQVRLSSWNFQGLVESHIPDFAGRPNRKGAELEKVRDSLPKIVFLTSYEHDLMTKTRTNIMGEYTYQKDLRQKVTELVINEAPHRLDSIHVEGGGDAAKELAEFKTLQTLTNYAGDILEHQNQNFQRINDFADANSVYLLEEPLREEARWNSLEEMNHLTRADVRNALRDWLPAQYQQRRAADLQQVAAFSPSVRASMLQKIDERAQEAEEEISAMPAAAQKEYRDILRSSIDASKRHVDPTFDITNESIENCSDVEALRDMAHRVAEYNGDARMALIYKKASQLTGDKIGAALAEEMKSTVYSL